MLGNQIIGRSFVDLPSLDYTVAPVGFLLVEKAVITLLGSAEYALRLFPVVAALVASMLMLKVAGACVSRVATLLAVASFVFCERLIYYASEVKPYSSDVMWSLLLLMIGLKCLNAHSERRAVFGFGVVSAVAVWFSYPSVFIITACFLVLFADAYRRQSTLSNGLRTLLWLTGSGMLVAASFLVCQFMTHDPNVSGLQSAWQSAFMPLPPWKDPVWLGKAFYGFLWSPMGLYFDSQAARSPANYALAIVAATLLAVGFLSLLFRRWQVALMLTLPFLLTLAASGLRRYPFAGRLLLFTMPLCVLLLAEGIERTGLWLGRRSRGAALSLAIFAGLFSMTIAGAFWRNVLHPPMYYQHIRPAMAYLGARKLASDVVYLGYLQPPSLPAVSYYANLFRFDKATYPSLRPLGAFPELDDHRIGEEQPAAGVDLGLQVISNGGKASRVWIVFTNVAADGSGAMSGHERPPLARIEQGGATRLDAFESRDASVYLYQLTN